MAAVAPPGAIERACVQPVEQAQEIGHAPIGRRAAQLARRCALRDDAVDHDRDAVGDLEGFLAVVGHDHAALAQRPLQLPELPPQRQAEMLVERGEGLVHQQQHGLRRQRPRQGHALPLAAREGRRQPVGERLQLDQRQQFLGAGIGHRGLLAPRERTEADVLAHRQVGEQRVMLEDHADVALLRRQRLHLLPAHRERAGIESLQPGDRAQQRRLSAARGAQQRDHLAARQRQVDAAQHRPAAQGQARITNGKLGHQVHRRESLEMATTTAPTPAKVITISAAA